MSENKAAATVLTDERILAALGSITHEVPKRLPPGWLKFARAIEREVLAHAGVTAEPAQTAVLQRPINMNTMAAVTLTAFGANERNWHYAWMRDQFPDVAPAQSKAGDTLTEPLWELFKIFGRNMSPGMPEVPFKGNEISLSAQVPAAEVRAQALEPECLSTDESREYLVEFMKQHFTDKTFHRYIRGSRGSVSLAGDFAWQMARALRMILAQSSTADKASEVRAVEEDAVRHVTEQTAKDYMEESLWAFIECAGNFPEVAPDPRIWPHLMVYAKESDVVKDAMRLRWLNEDHDDAEVREKARDLAGRLGTSSYFAITRDIDSAMAAAPSTADSANTGALGEKGAG